jgi:hypothetical protein
MRKIRIKSKRKYKDYGLMRLRMHDAAIARSSKFKAFLKNPY